MCFITEPLNASHHKNEFSCGKGMLDHYVHHQAGQDTRRKLASCFILRDKPSGLIQGYYTLSGAGIPLDHMPTAIKKKLPQSYPSIPSTLLGRLAVDLKFKGKGLGKLLLIDALKRSYETSRSIGSFCVVVDPLDLEAENFYKKYGFIKLPDSGKMFMPMKTIQLLFE